MQVSPSVKQQMDEILAKEMPPVTQWKAVLDLLLKESLAWKATLEPSMVSLATNGFLSKEVLRGKDPVLREVMSQGWSWIIISWAVEECFPKLAERALNSSNSAFQAQSELELALHILDLASGTHKPDFKALAAEACHAGPVKNYSSSIAKLAMLTTNFTAPKTKIQDGYARLLTRSDRDKLKGNKLQKQILDTEKKLFQAYQKVEASFSELAAARA
eukprot:s8034_g1.t1